MNLENKKNILIIIAKVLIFIAIAVLGYLFVYNKTKVKIEKSEDKMKIDEKIDIYQKKENKDTDGDGVPDWKEVENMTNIYVKDNNKHNQGDNSGIDISNISNYSKVESIIKPEGIIQGVPDSKEIKQKDLDFSYWNFGTHNNTNNINNTNKNNKVDNSHNQNYNDEITAAYKRDINKIIIVDIFNGNTKDYEEAFGRYVRKEQIEHDKIPLERKIQYFKEQKNKYLSIKMETPEMKKLLKRLIKSAEKSAAYLAKIKDFKYENTDKKKKEYTEIFTGYSGATGEKSKVYIEINNLLVSKKIKFKKSEPGYFFEFKA